MACPRWVVGELANLLNAEVMTTLTAADVAPGADDLMPVLVGVSLLLYYRQDIRRYINVLPFALALLGREVAAVDLLALEALRLFCPRSTKGFLA